jgi:serine/threonine protein phosphatase PrpC
VRFRIDLAVSVPKDTANPQLNEDAWAQNNSLTCFALADGASESFDSKTWARLLVDKYVSDCAFSPDWVADAVQAYSRQYDFDKLTWSAQHAFARGSFSTLLGLSLGANDTDLDVLSIGDCLAVLVRDGEILHTFPFTTPEQFDERPTLLSTSGPSNALWAANNFFGSASTTWQAEPGDIVYAVSDAVGRWVLELPREGKDISQVLAELQAETIETMFQELRETRKLKLDDWTVLRLILEREA